MTEIIKKVSKFNEEQNEEIYKAINTIRLKVRLGIPEEDREKPGSIWIVEISGRISGVLYKKNWEELFNDKEWIQFLEGAVSYNSLNDGVIAEPLKVVAKYFKEEIKQSGILYLLTKL